MKKAIAALVVIVVIAGLWWLFFRQPPQPPATATPHPSASQIQSSSSAPTVDPKDLRAAKRAAEKALRAYFATPSPAMLTELESYATKSFLDSLRAEWTGTQQDLLVKADSIKVEDFILLHTENEIVLTSAVKWSVWLDGEKIDDHRSEGVISLVYDKAWLVNKIDDLPSEDDETVD